MSPSKLIQLHSRLPTCSTSPRVLEMLSLAKSNKKENAKEGAEGMVVVEVLSVTFADGPPRNLEWSRYFRASRHVCNDLNGAIDFETIQFCLGSCQGN